MRAGRYGSDLVVDLMVEAGIEHVALNPGASFRGIHDSIAQRPGEAPSLALCLQEATAVSVAHGYAKAAGRPMAALLHDVVGLQQATMAIYNAWCDRAPVLLIGGSGPMSKAKRRRWIDWIHTASSQADLIRDYVKWDDEPRDAQSVPESFARGLRAACAEPPAPVYLCYDAELQEAPLERELEREPLSAYAPPTAPAPSVQEVARVASTLRAAQRPVLAAGYAGESDRSFGLLGELAELLGAPVIDTGVRLAAPTTHPFNATGVDGVVEEADVVLKLDAEDPRGLIGDRVRAKATVCEVSLSHLRLRSWAHDYQALEPAEQRITASAAEALEAIVAALRHEPPSPDAVSARAASARDRIAAERRRWRSAAASADADGRGVALERLVYELGERLDGRRFVLANATNDRIEHRLWALDRPGQYLGWHGGGGLGYGPGAAIGAALAEPEAIVVDVQADGDLMFVPGALWTMAHLGVAVLVVVHNNRQYGNTVEHAAAVARERGRDDARRYDGAGLGDPPIDFAGLARSLGVWASGPIEAPGPLGAALDGAIEVVAGGRPALVDVLTPGF